MKRLTAAAILVVLSAVTAFGAVQDSSSKLTAATGTRESFVARHSHRSPRGNVDSFRDNNGNTRLILAAVYGNTREVRELIEAGADINIRNKYGMSALMYASERNNADVVRILLRNGANINARNHEGSTSLIIAAIHGCEESANILMDAGANVRVRNNDGMRALDYARRNEHLRGTHVLKRLERRSR